jgi:hypothetical protein
MTTVLLRGRLVPMYKRKKICGAIKRHLLVGSYNVDV